VAQAELAVATVEVVSNDAGPTTMRFNLPSLVLLSAGFAACNARAQQPAYPVDQGPVVLVDANYRNLISLRLRPSLIESFKADGYRVIERDGEVTAESLQNVKIMVSASPVAPQNALPTELPPPNEKELAAQISAAWRLPTPSAYSVPEVNALEDWVKAGGALLVIVDHMPFPGAVQELTSRFGFQLANGHAVAAKEEDRSLAIRFSRLDGSLGEHTITAGRNAAEHIEAIETYGGAAFRSPPEGQSVMTFGPGYEQQLPKVWGDLTEDPARTLIEGWSQGAVVRVGLGRVAVFTEAGFFMAAPPDEVGSEIRQQNHQFLLNVIHWLSGLLN